MNGFATSTTREIVLTDEEKVSLLRDDKALSDIESDAGRAELESRFGVVSSTVRTARSWWAANAGTCARGLKSLSWWRTAVKRSCVFLLPSFVQHRLSSRDRRKRLDRLGLTSYLHGMRGVAAFCVFFCHYFYTCFRIAEGWGYGEDNCNLLKLPFIRLWYQGPPMVCVFFVISGYALSLKPLRLVRERSSSSSSGSSSRSTEAFSTIMSSFIFRRFFRLFLPTAASTLLIAPLLQLGAYEATRDFAYDKTYMRNVQETHPEQLSTLSAQLRDWSRAMFEFGQSGTGRSSGAAPHTTCTSGPFPSSSAAPWCSSSAWSGWPARLRTGARFTVVGVSMLFCYRSDRWEMLLFYSGMVLAELDLIRGAHSDPLTTATPAPAAATMNTDLLPTTCAAAAATTINNNHSNSTNNTNNTPPSSVHTVPAVVFAIFVVVVVVVVVMVAMAVAIITAALPMPPRARSVLWTALGIVVLYFMCQPDVGYESTPGWRLLSALTSGFWSDGYRYYQTLGSVLLVAAVARLPAWQSAFNAPAVQYLGRISYAVYLMPGPVLHTLGYAVERRAWALTGAETEARYVAGFVLASALVVPAVVWAADVFWMAVDAPFVRFAKWLEARCSVSD